MIRGHHTNLSQAKQRKRKKQLKLQITCVLSLCFLFLFCLTLVFTSTMDGPRNEMKNVHSRHLTSSDTFPEVFSEEKLKSGAVIFHFMGMCYTFVGIALVCDEYFVPALEVMGEHLGLSDDVQGATLMAAGGSAPELFTSLIGTLIMRTDVGFGTVVGSAVFNVLFVIAMSALFSRELLQLTGWPLARDSIYYAVSLVILALFFGFITPKFIDWYEALILFLMYWGYVFLMKNNERLYGMCTKNKNKNNSADTTLDETVTLSTNMSEGNVSQSAISIPEGTIGRPPTFKTGVNKFLTRTKNTTTDQAEMNVKTFINILQERGDTELSKSKIKQILLATGHRGDVDSFMNTWNTESKTTESFLEWHNQIIEKIKEAVETEFSNDQIEKEKLEIGLENLPRGDKTAATVAENYFQYLGETNSQATQIYNRNIFLQWYKLEYFFANAAEDDDADFPNWPSETKAQIYYVITAPLMFPMYYSMSDVKKKEKQNCKNASFTFFISIFWIGFYSTFMVEWADTVGTTVGVAPKVMGLTIIAAGTSIPDLISSVIVARQGKGDMAVSSSIGSNIFDILVGLPIPWLLGNAIFGESIPVEAGDENGSLLFSIIILMLMLATTILTIALAGWKLTKGLALGMFILYILFVTQDLLRAYNIVPSPL